YVSEVITDLDKSLPPVPCKIAEINQVILNMVVNAAHAIEEVLGENPQKKGTITIKTRKNDKYAEIIISDTGKGIPEDLRSKIFDPFFTTKDVGKGTGMGLNLAHNIISEHGGTINVESEVGAGTTFTIRLPLNGQVSSESKEEMFY
ncbi:MAG TPA: GHKL domain-containing protein, partial [Deltaproteobacteria bacterium]|nr:GHKL domain-containing protein [Deltaproteobacteria bacterium]